MTAEFDLLGDPIPQNFGKPGANGHTPNAESANKIRVLLVAGMNLDRIAKEIGITVPTLRKHYFANGKVKAKVARDKALAEARARNLLQLEKAAAAGNVSAMGKVRKILDEEERRLADDVVKDDAKKQPEPPKGKKQRDQISAAQGEAELDRLVNRERMN